MNLSQVDLNLLVALDALLTERNVTRAGEKVGLSQPAMSSALARLRRLFHDELLVREGRTYQLTLRAQELHGPLHNILDLIDQTIEKRAAFDPAVDERAFTVITADHMAFLVFQPLFQRFLKEAPAVKLQIQPLVQTPAEIDLVHTDLVIGFEKMIPSAEHQVLFRDGWVCAAWSGNTEVGDRLTLEDYQRLPHLGYGASISHLSGLADQAASARYPHRNVAVSVETFFLIPFLLAGTNMLAFMHEGVGRRLAAISDIRLLEVPFEVPTVAEAMFWHPRFTADPAHRWLRRQIADSAAAVRADMDVDSVVRRARAKSASQATATS